jgi:hypothetical protein
MAGLAHVYVFASLALDCKPMLSFEEEEISFYDDMCCASSGVRALKC